MTITENINRSVFYYDFAKGVLGGNTRRHYHDNFEVYYLESGECNYFVDNRYYSLVAGDLILIPSGLIHQTNYGKEVHSRRLINCCDEYIPPELREELSSNNYIIRNPLIRKEISEIFGSIEKEYSLRDEYSDRIIKAHTYRLFYLIFRHKEENIISVSENKTVERVIEYLKNNYMNDISLSEVAEKNAVSEAHLSRAFKKETGIGFSEYINNLRLQRAEYMLRHEEGKSVSEVAFACGFNDSNYFSYRFKKTFGISPKCLKKQNLPQ